jgi:hypothetical protein
VACDCPIRSAEFASNPAAPEANSAAFDGNAAEYPSNSANHESNAAELQMTRTESSTPNSAAFDANKFTSESISARYPSDRSAVTCPTHRIEQFRQRNENKSTAQKQTPPKNFPRSKLCTKIDANRGQQDPAQPFR